MRVFKASYKDRKGKARESAKWYVELPDHRETTRRLPGYTDRKQTEELGRKLEKLVAARSNSETPDLPLSKWLESIPNRMRQTLARWGLLEARTYAAGKPLTEHVDDFHAALVSKGGTEQHANLTRQRVLTLITDCGFTFWTDINATRVEQYLAERREAKEDGERSRSRQTSNYYLQAAKQFCRWMVKRGLAVSSPLEHLSPINAAVDRKHDRRALSVDELRRLLAATVGGPERFGISATERAVIYRLAAESGLRANELRSLTRSSFSFGAKLATVTVEAGSSKRRRRDELPLRPDTAAAMKAHLAGKHPGAQAFNLPRADNMADMIRRDLAAARAAWLDENKVAAEREQRERSTFLCTPDEAGRVFDFHGLRHTFLTNLARSGVHPKLAQQLARHSTITLTMDRYSHVTLAEQGEALTLLPDLSAAVAQEQRATGTDGRIVADPVLADCLAFSGAESCRSVPLDASQALLVASASEGDSSRENATFAAILRGENQVRLSGLEPETYGLKVRPALAPSTEPVSTSGDVEFVLADCLAFFDRESSDLAAVCRAWPSLPEAIRAGILAMVQASRGAGQ